MALEVEDGTGKADAEAYASVGDADAYLASRGYTLWASEMQEGEKEQALRRASDYMLQVYGPRWKGDRASETQALDWPRSGVEAYGYEVDNDTVPPAVVNANIELAYKAASGELAADIDRLTKREKLGPMEVEYVDGGLPYKQYRAIDNMLLPYLASGGSGVFRSVVRT